MRLNFSHILRGALAAPAILGGAIASATAAEYRLVVNSDDCASCNTVHDINAGGLVVGSYQTERNGSYFAAYWEQGATGFRPLESTFADVLSGTANAVNSSGVIVGYERNTPYLTAVMWPQDAAPVQLPNLSAQPTHGCAAWAINARGVVAGSCALRFGGKEVTHAVIWKNGQVIDLDPSGIAPPRQDRYVTTARALNDTGFVAGSRDWEIGKNVFNTRAVLWKRGKATLLPTLASSVGTTFDDVSAINDAGVMVGSGAVGTVGRLSALKWADGKVVNLGTLPGDVTSWSAAADINRSGTIVGASYPTSASGGRAVIWTDVGITDLNTLLSAQDQTKWRLGSARAINDAGQITGLAINQASGKFHMYRLDPLP